MEQKQCMDVINMLKEIEPFGNYEMDTMIFESGYMDSLKVFERLLPKIEELFGVTVEPSDLIPDNFETPTAIMKYIEGKKHE